MPSSRGSQRLQDILDNIARIERFTAGMDLESFGKDEEKLFAVKPALLIISKAGAKLGERATELCPEINWQDVRSFGNRLRHEYDSIDVVRLWDIVKGHLSPLKIAVQGALKRLLEKEGGAS
ncbi:MAG: HepT-like ribonuclease domain-containing protein [Bryobacteraceae bacterium]